MRGRSKSPRRSKYDRAALTDLPADISIGSEFTATSEELSFSGTKDRENVDRLIESADNFHKAAIDSMQRALGQSLSGSEEEHERKKQKTMKSEACNDKK